jgi:hypothetical protein
MIAVIFIGVPMLILVLRDRIRRAWRERPGREAARAGERQVYKRRILEPDWPCVERHLRRPVPDALRQLYADTTLVTSRDLRYSMEESISTFEPLDEQGMRDAQAWLGFEAVAVATTADGDSIYLRPGSSDPNVVYVTRHDGGDTELFAETLEGMVETLRRANPAP